MRKRDRKELGRYCRHLADQCELRDWTIHIEHEPINEAGDGERVLAAVHPLYGRKEAYVRVCPDFRDQDPNEIRHILVHELVHCHFVAAQQMAEDDLTDLIGRQADALFHRAFRRNLEYGVDATAAAIAKHLPLIEWSK